ncbi:EamA family transporter [Allofrancisella guangzhouensis]|uniref:Cytochrome B6 n=1 Tax=Allofrancisella guangzhouensis TaxID=594679 RepID=A0A0A8E4R1_9GAMM|nr:DMT family transporter [Allofrancisella guangzhouensis]AJC48954.1 cytochrome B6 [Allofrancisella guangzhouensis]MBK2027080.1 EamA family transporter [Allofrancisella guangzhouensis]MBK2044197.1 EamA family transporter [Allofrancisella guangzhouensis]MBK2045682.1 EamA family transporter [Allofrancisella guangzhouensis]
MNISTKSYIKILLVVTFWASLYHIAPLPLRYIDIYLVGFIRYLFASLILLLVHYYYTKTFLPNLSIKQWLYIIAIGFFGVFLYNIAFLWAEKLISGNIVAIIYAFSPCFITLLSSYIFKMKVNLQAKLGILVALLGTVGVVSFSGYGTEVECSVGLSINLGEILSILAVLCFSAYAILGKSCVRQGINMITINTYGAIVGMIMFATISLFKSDFSKLADTDFPFWISMIYISVFATVVSYLWYLQSLEEIGVYKTAVFQNVMPFLVIVIGFIFYGETLSSLSLIFGGVIFLGVYMTNVAINKKGCC